MSNIIDFPHGNQPQPQPDFSAVSQNMFDAVNDMLKAMPASDLASQTSRLVWLKLARMLTYMELTGRISAVLTESGFDPNRFVPDQESFEDFLIMDAEDYPEDEMDEPDNVLNGPYFDFQQEDRIIRAATTLGFNEVGSATSAAIHIMSLNRGDARWQIFGDGVWDEGPDADEFGIDPFEEDED